MARQGTKDFQGASWDGTTGQTPNSTLDPNGDPPHRVTERYFDRGTTLDTDGTEWLCVERNDGTRVWVIIGGPSVSGVLTDYWVGPDQGVSGPRTIYHDPIDALAAMNADAALVPGRRRMLLWPGDYDLGNTMLRLLGGQSIASVGSTSVPVDAALGTPGLLPARLINGVVSFESAALDTEPNDISGLELQNCPVWARNAGTGTSSLRDCYGWTAPGGNHTNDSPLLAFSATASLTVDDSAFVITTSAPGVLVPAVFLSFETFTLFRNVVAQNTVPVDYALRIQGDSVLEWTGGQLGGVAVTDAGAGNILFAENVRVSMPGPNAFTVGAGSTQQWQTPTLAGCTAPLASGAGTFILTRPTSEYDNPGTTAVAAATITTTVEYAPSRKRILPVGPGATAVPQDCDGVYVSTGGVAIVVALPTLSTVPHGTPYWIKSITAAGDIAATPDGAAAIDFGVNGAAQAMVATANGVSRTFTADRVNAKWRTS